jgi:hypothetical protein
MEDLGIARKFLDMEIEYGNKGSIKIHQDQYVQQLLNRHGMGECNTVATPLDTTVKLSIKDNEVPADPQEYARIVGGLMFTACIARPDITCAVGQLSQFLNNPSSTHMHRSHGDVLTPGRQWELVSFGDLRFWNFGKYNTSIIIYFYYRRRRKWECWRICFFVGLCHQGIYLDEKTFSAVDLTIDILYTGIHLIPQHVGFKVLKPDLKPMLNTLKPHGIGFNCTSSRPVPIHDQLSQDLTL